MTTKRQVKMEVAQTILNQLGGNRFIVMTGAKNFVAGDYTLTFRIPKAKQSINMVKIYLNGLDLYDVTFYRVRGVDVKEIKKVDGLYFDMLQETFTEVTGLYTNLR